MSEFTGSQLYDMGLVYKEVIAESAVPGKPAERLGAVTAIPTDEREAARQRTLAKAAALRAKKGITQEALDRTEVKRWWDDDGDGKGYEKGEVSGKFKKKKKKVKESFSNWRNDLREIVDEIVPKSAESNVQTITGMPPGKKNKINVSPSFKEAVEEIGGELIEMIEIDEKTLTSAETSKKEEIVKSMKKNLPGFRKRYGDRAKEVMYATATKQAKKVAEQATETAPTSTTHQQKPNTIDQQQLKNKELMMKKRNQLQTQQLTLQKQGKLPLNTEAKESAYDDSLLGRTAERAKRDDLVGMAIQKNPEAYQRALKQMAVDRENEKKRKEKIRNNPG